MINMELLEKQGMLHNKTKIEEIMLDIKEVFGFLEYVINTNYYHDFLKRMVSDIEKWEFELQELWGFKRDATRHRYWYRVPGCTCPIMDNDDRLGVNERVINSICPYHSIKE